MLDINRIRKSPAEVKAALAKRDYHVDIESILELDRKNRELQFKLQELQSKRNSVSEEIGKCKRTGQDAGAMLAEMKEISRLVKEVTESAGQSEAALKSALEVLPNTPADDVVAGGKEANEVQRVINTKPNFDFAPKDHVEIATKLGLIDYERGVKLGGSGFWIYRGAGARLEWALLNYFIAAHLKDGYEFVLPPHLLNWECGFAAGQFPKFAEDVFHLAPDKESDRSGLFLLPTAETALINLYRDEIIKETELPFKLFGYTPCFRREAGSYRASERGMIRGHQFNKVELFIYCTPENSEALHQELVSKAEKLVADLGLHFRISKLAGGDIGASMAKTYDIEVWIPSMNEYKEVSSVSNAGDFQARRGSIRYHPQAGGSNKMVHTLNASGLATSRLFPAILETFQLKDGSVEVPKVLQPYYGASKIELHNPPSPR